MIKTPPLYVCLMAGGSGTRFWPASRSHCPKQLLRLVGEGTLIQETHRRLHSLTEPSRTLVVTARSQVRAVAQQLPELPNENLLSEPIGRNTAACAGLAATFVAGRDPDAVLALFPADHVIRDADRWRALVEQSARLVAESDRVVTFGLTPTRPETGFGYIRLGEPITFEGMDGLHEVDAFVEKPDLDRATEFVRTGRYLWNGGVFIAKARRFLGLIREHLPDLAEGLSRIGKAKDSRQFRTLVNKVYPTLPSVSLDQGVMEKTRGLIVVRADVGWSDVGSWAALSDVVRADERGNVALGPSLSIDSENCVTYSSGSLIATLGVQDLVVVQTKDAILVCPRNRTQEVRQIVDRLRLEGKTWLV